MKKRVLNFMGVLPVGNIGELTPITDKNGEELRVGDLTLFELSQDEGFKLHNLTVIAKDEGIYHAFGLASSFDKNGKCNESLTLTKIKGHETIATGDVFGEPDEYFEYCEEEVEE